MPIVAGIGGNSGNQTITMIVRAMAMGQLTDMQAGRLLKKKSASPWSTALFGDGDGSGFVAALRQPRHRFGHGCRDDAQPPAGGNGRRIDSRGNGKFGRDPALGSSVLITAVTDSGGFLIFLSLATLFLL